MSDRFTIKRGLQGGAIFEKYDRADGHGKNGQVKMASCLGRSVKVGGKNWNRGSLIDFLNTQNEIVKLGRLKKGILGLGGAKNNQVCAAFRLIFEQTKPKIKNDNNKSQNL